MFGTLICHPEFSSQYVMPRNVDIWLPPGYHESGTNRFPVLYMHDGQNLFNPDTSFTGVAWGVDEAIVRLKGESKVREIVVVGIWNTTRRLQEYLPQRPLEQSKEMVPDDRINGAQPGMPLSDNYLRFIVTELKPFVDNTYRTLAGRSDTFMMGSSMGGLVSLYALCEYPEVFGGAGCLSTHWPAVEGTFTEYLERALPGPGTHKVYFDFGTETLDASYEEDQRQVDEVMRTAGYVNGSDWVTKKFEGAEHSERAWRERVHIPLLFFFGSEKNVSKEK